MHPVIRQRLIERDLTEIGIINAGDPSNALSMDQQLRSISQGFATEDVTQVADIYRSHRGVVVHTPLRYAGG
jgi:hypothetical protein